VLVERVGVAGWSVVSENGVTVALDTALDDDLLLEGRLLDLIHTVNVLRKESGLDVTDRIRLVAPDGDVVRVYADRLAAETLAVSVEVGELGLEKV
jgi:isoleucyl-tRNA synthetase